LSERQKIAEALWYGACEKAGECPYASEGCYKSLKEVPLNELNCAPKRRWVLCSAWKMALGMVFDKRSGSWIYPKNI
jgi:hypothetical protein